MTGKSVVPAQWLGATTAGRTALFYRPDDQDRDGALFAAHLSLMECFAEQENRGAALEQYRTLIRTPDEELGMEPGTRAQEVPPPYRLNRFPQNPAVPRDGSPSDVMGLR